MFHPQQQIGPYTLVRLLGQGGFGQVWLAEKRGSLLTPQVALKLPLDPDPDLTAVQQEARLWLQASGHPNVLPVLDAEVYKGQVVIVSEYAAGGSLSAWLKQHGGKAPTVDEAVAMIAGILAGLEYLHTLTPQPIIHRDLKPDNILLQGGHPRLTDFGISRVLKTTSQTQNASGTPPYMPPEAFRGRYSAQSDIWAAGILLYQMLSGKLPFPQPDIASLYGAIVHDNPPDLPPDIPPELAAVVAKALAKTPTERFASAAEMQEELKRVTTAPPPQRGALSPPDNKMQAGWKQVAISTVPSASPPAPRQDWLAQSELARPRAAEHAVDKRLVKLCVYPVGIASAAYTWQFFIHNGAGFLLSGLFGFVALVLGGFLGLCVAVVLVAIIDSMRGRLTPYRTLTGHRMGIRAVAISSDNQRVVTGSEDMTAKVWEAATGKELLTLTGHRTPILAVALSSDSKRILTCSEDEAIKGWDTETGAELFTIQGPCDHISAVAISPDSNRLVTTMKDDTGKIGTTRVWDLETGRVCLTLSGHGRHVSSVAISADGRRVVTPVEDTRAKVWDSATGQELFLVNLEDLGLHVVALSNDGKRIIAGCNSFALVWDEATGKKVSKYAQHRGYVRSIAMTGDGRQVVTCSAFQKADVKVWDADTTSTLVTLKAHNSSVDAVAISADGRCVVTGSSDKTANLWILPCRFD